MEHGGQHHKEPKQLGELLSPVKPLSRVHKRLLTMPLFEEGEDANIIYQHSVYAPGIRRSY